MKKGQIETVVFEVVDPEAANALFEAFKNDTTICGLRPFALGAGNQMTKPTEIVEILSEVDPESPDRDTLREAVKLVDRYHAEQLAGINMRSA